MIAFCAGILCSDDFLIVTEAEINISLGFISLFKKSLNGFHDADKVVLHIKSASAPDELAVVIAAERLMSPITLGAGSIGTTS